MTGHLNLPDTASVANKGEGDKLIAPSAARNLAPLCDLLEHVAPRAGRALEIASGTGQHVVAFAARFPEVQWQPTEPDAARRASIIAHAGESGCANIAPALELDACKPGWGARMQGQDLIVVINLLHLVPMDWVEVLIAEAAQALSPGGRFVIYGPFMRAGELTSAGDEAFHASLTAQDSRIGYKDDFDVIDLVQSAGLDLAEVVEMPANNLALIAEKPSF